MIVYAKYPSFNQVVEVGEVRLIGSLFEGYAAYYQGKVLPSNYCISKNYMDITLIPIIKGGMQIFIRLLNGKTFTIDLLNVDETTVEQVKKLIFEKESIPIEDQKLYNAGKIMENEHLLRKYNVQAETVLHLAIKEVEKPFQIKIKMIAGDQIFFELPKRDNTTIDEVKKLIKSRNGTSMDAMDLLSMGKVMDDDAKTLKEYGVSDNSELLVSGKLNKVSYMECIQRSAKHIATVRLLAKKTQIPEQFIFLALVVLMFLLMVLPCRAMVFPLFMLSHPIYLTIKELAPNLNMQDSLLRLWCSVGILIILNTFLSVIGGILINSMMSFLALWMIWPGSNLPLLVMNVCMRIKRKIKHE